jgi:hypothetical protein
VGKAQQRTSSWRGFVDDTQSPIALAIPTWPGAANPRCPTTGTSISLTPNEDQPSSSGAPTRPTHCGAAPTAMSGPSATSPRRASASRPSTTGCARCRTLRRCTASGALHSVRQLYVEVRTQRPKSHPQLLTTLSTPAFWVSVDPFSISVYSWSRLWAVEVASHTRGTLRSNDGLDVCQRKGWRPLHSSALTRKGRRSFRAGVSERDACRDRGHRRGSSARGWGVHRRRVRAGRESAPSAWWAGFPTLIDLNSHERPTPGGAAFGA